MYWTNDGSSSDVIEVSDLDGTNRLVLIHEELEKPSDIVVHPTAGSVVGEGLGVVELWGRGWVWPRHC